MPADEEKPDAINRTRHARADLKRSEKTHGEVELDDIHTLLSRQWYLIITMTILMALNSLVTFTLLWTR